MICLNPHDKTSIKAQFKSDGVLANANQERYLLYEDVDSSTPAQHSNDFVISPEPISSVVVELERTQVDLFIISSSSSSDNDKKRREELIHYLYDHLGVPLLCV